MMDRCTDERIGRKLYAYELGQLSDDGCREVEVHLFECEYCYRRSLGFQEATRMIRGDAAVRSEIERLSEEVSEGAWETVPIERKRWPNIIRLSLAAAAAVVILLLKPWDLELHLTKEAMAYEDILAVMYFDNMAEPEDKSRLGEIVTDMVITDLAASDYMHVMSSQRLYDLLKSIGHEGEKSFDRSVATEVAKKGRARWMMTGSILQQEPTVVLSAQIVDVGTGNVIEARRIAGEAGENVFAVVDQLTAEVRTALRIPREDINKYDRAVADITTTSLEAYRHYIAGLDFYYKQLTLDARLQLAEAYEADSTFAMAYYMWTRCWIENNAERKAAIDAAMKYIDRANDIQQRYIRARYAEVYEDYEAAIKGYQDIIDKYPDEKWAYYYLGSEDFPGARLYEGDYQKAIDLLMKAVEIDPTFKLAYAALYSQYIRIGQAEKARWVLDKYMEVAPDDPWPYYILASSLKAGHQFEEAIAAYHRVLDISPDQIGTLVEIANIYHFMGDFGRADSVNAILLMHRNPETRAYARERATKTPRAQGKFRNAIALLEQGIEDDKKDIGPSITMAFKYGTMAYIYSVFLNDHDKAVELTKKNVEIIKRVSTSFFVSQALGDLASFYAYNRQFDQADSLINEIRRNYEDSYLKSDNLLNFYLGVVEYEKGNYDSAIACYQASALNFPVFTVFYELGRSHYAAGDIDSAVADYKRALDCYGRVRALWPDFAVAAEYELGKAYEAGGQTALAIRQYEKFLDLWKEADPGLWMIEDARARLERLYNSP